MIFNKKQNLLSPCMEGQQHVRTICVTVSVYRVDHEDCRDLMAVSEQEYYTQKRNCWKSHDLLFLSMYDYMLYFSKIAQASNRFQ